MTPGGYGISMDGNQTTKISVDGTPRLFNSKEARRILGGISEAEFRKLTGSGRLPAKKQGHRVYIRGDVLERYIEALPDVQTTVAA